MSKCWFCGTEMVWQNDFDAKDYGYEKDGIVAILHCYECNTIANFILLEEV